LKQKVSHPMCEQNGDEWMQHVIHKVLSSSLKSDT
jgi:hypothetical protein